jgi:hypothetical protein
MLKTPVEHQPRLLLVELGYFPWCRNTKTMPWGPVLSKGSFRICETYLEHLPAVLPVSISCTMQITRCPFEPSLYYIGTKAGTDFSASSLAHPARRPDDRDLAPEWQSLSRCPP